MIYRIQPYEVRVGDTDQAFHEAMQRLCTTLPERRPFEDRRDLPAWLSSRIAKHKGGKWESMVQVAGKGLRPVVRKGLWEGVSEFRDRLNQVEVDRLRVKPVVKIMGEFWAQITEGDGNFNMFVFLEREGAQVCKDGICGEAPSRSSIVSLPLPPR
jgi:hypothetical protein